MAKPSFGVGLNTGNSLYTNLGLCFPFNDSSGNPKDAKSTSTITLTGGVTWGTESGSYNGQVVGGWIKGDGSTGYAQGNFSGINSHSTQTVALLANAPSGDVQFSPQWLKVGGNVESKISFNQGGNLGIAAPGNIASLAALADGNWHLVHHLIAYGAQEFYVDGVSQGTAAFGFDYGAGDVYLLEDATGPYRSNAMIAGVWVWNAVLTSGQVAAHRADMWQMFGATMTNRILQVITSGGD